MWYNFCIVFYVIEIYRYTHIYDYCVNSTGTPVLSTEEQNSNTFELYNNVNSTDNNSC